MKRNMKFVTALAASLLAVAPVINLGAEQNINIVKADENKLTINSFFSDIFKPALMLDPSTNHQVEFRPGNDVSVTNVRIFYNGKDIYANSLANTTLKPGTYTVYANMQHNGAITSFQDRHVNIINQSGAVLGKATVSSNSTLATGQFSFKVTVNNDGTFGQPIYVASSSQKTAKKSIKRAKRSKKSKKSKRNNKKRTSKKRISKKNIK